MSDPTPAQLLAAARAVERSPAVYAGSSSWARAAAFLARLALEAATDQFWAGLGHDLSGCSWRTKLLGLGWFTGDAEAAHEVHQTWAALSRACHHHPYEMAPTAAELERWLRQVDGAFVVLGAARAGSWPSSDGSASLPQAR
jgi:hypothetical protein